MGLTASGAYLDQPEHMPRSYVDQVGLRCSVDGAKIVFSNNPSGPLHWLKTEYIDKEAETNGVHVSLRVGRQSEPLESLRRPNHAPVQRRLLSPHGAR